MDRVLAQVDTAGTVPVLRGLEDHASAHYFRALRALLNPEYGFRTRNRRPPRDPANALLSFAYTLLTAEATAAVAAAGLEPALGLYHRPRGGRPALALDLVEEFRAPAADALVLQLTGWRAISPEDFLPRGGGVRMRARGRFLEGYEQKMAKAFTSRHGTPTTLREAVRAQAAELAGSIRTGRTYVPFKYP
jgi:CRISPR-associated protein Cas1